jgi:branched-chain amino acid transport system substrate-binding protein
VARTEHDTLIGKIRFTGSENTATPGTVGQWQKGEFEVVWPRSMATAPLLAHKPAWV